MKTTFHEYYLDLTPADREQLALDCGSSTGYLSQISTGHRKAGAGLIDRLMDSGRRDVVRLLRPAWFPDEEEKKRA